MSSKKYCIAYKTSGTGTPCRRYGYPEYNGYCRQHYEMSLSGKLNTSAKSSKSPRCKAFKTSGTGTPCRRKGHAEFDGYCRQHYEMIKTGAVVESISGPTSSNDAFESEFKKRLPFALDPRKLDPDYSHAMEDFSAALKQAENIIRNSPKVIRHTIEDYTHGKIGSEPFDRTLNSYLEARAKRKNKPVKEYLERATSYLNQATKSMRLPNMVVWRGMNRPENINQIQMGLVTLPAFTSTSYMEDRAFNFVDKDKGCCMLQIHVKSGAYGLPVESVSNYDEKEILLPNNSQIKVHYEFLKQMKGKSIRYFMCTYK